MSAKADPGPRTIRAWAPLVLLAAAAAVAPRGARAQGIRGWATTTVQGVEMRPIAMDTVSRADVLVDAAGNATYQGQPVTCVSDTICIGYRSRGKARTSVMTQDLSLTAWGLGMQGLSITTMLRGRAHGGSAFVWPQADNAFDAILAYAQLVRGQWRFRAGRQEVRSGLGFSAFDGGAATYTRRHVRLEAYGGRSLARALREPANEALQGLEDFVPDQNIVLFGGAAGVRSSTTSFTARYQRQILSDRSGLESERGEVDVTSVMAGARFTGSADYDFGFGRWGKAHLTVTVPLDPKWLLEATARRYVPYFSLNTIWGYFDPVAYNEIQGRLSWSPAPSFGAWGTLGVRDYGNAGTVVVLSPLKRRGTRASAGFNWQLGSEWVLDGDWALEYGPGGYLSSGDGTIRWKPIDRLSVAATGTTFQEIEQYRLGDGRAYGGGLNFQLDLNGRASLSGGATVMRLHDRGGSVDSPWNQTRAWSALRIRVGNDPGMSLLGRRPR